MKKYLTIGLTGMLALGSPLLANDFDAPSDIYVSSAVAAGSGCPGVVNPEVTLYDGGALLVLGVGYEDIFAEAGEGISRRGFRKFCQHSISLDYDADVWTYAVANAYSTAFVDFESSKYLGTLSTTVYFQGSSQKATVSAEFGGPDFSLLDYEEEFDQLIFAPCGKKRNLNIKNAAKVKASRRTLEYGGLGFDRDMELELVWRLCE